MLEKPDNTQKKRDVPRDLGDDAIRALAEFADATTTSPEDREAALRNIAEQFPKSEGPDEAE